MPSPYKSNFVNTYDELPVYVTFVKSKIIPKLET